MQHKHSPRVVCAKSMSFLHLFFMFSCMFRCVNTNNESEHYNTDPHATINNERKSRQKVICNSTGRTENSTKEQNACQKGAPAKCVQVLSHKHTVLFWSAAKCSTALTIHDGFWTDDARYRSIYNYVYIYIYILHNAK